MLLILINLAVAAYSLRAFTHFLLTPNSDLAWVWLGVFIAVLTLSSAAASKLLARPLERLAQSATQLNSGEFQPSHLQATQSSREVDQIEANLSAVAAQLAKVEEERKLMLAGISHDLRTPLTRLRLATEMHVDQAQAREQISADIDQLDDTIKQFLEYASPKARALQPYDAVQLIHATVAPFQNAPDAAGQSSVRIYMNLPSQLNVLAHGLELKRVVTNLIENARRYGKGINGSTAQVTVAAAVDTTTRPPTVAISFTDEGQGVPPEQLLHLTRPFFRGDSARGQMQGQSGAGLGLSIVHKLVKNMGGSLSIKNANPHGLCVTLTLRLAPPSTTKATRKI